MSENGEEEYGFGLAPGGNERIGSPTDFQDGGVGDTEGMPDAATLESMFRALMETMNVTEVLEWRGGWGWRGPTVVDCAE